MYVCVMLECGYELVCAAKRKLIHDKFHKHKTDVGTECFQAV